jgi:hypothetical protein
MTVNSIPASAIVAVTPGVLAAGGSALDLSGLVLTTNPRIPIGTVLSFASYPDVSAYFGPTSQEAGIAAVYFLGFDNSNKKPGQLLFSQYPTANVGAYLRGGSIALLPLTALQALTGVLTVTIDGTPRTSSTINLSAATSPSNAAAIIATALGGSGPQHAAFTGSISTTVLTVSAMTSGAIQVGDVIAGGTVSAGTTIIAQLSGSPGVAGTYTVSASQTVTSAALTASLPVVSYDATAGAFVVSSGTTGASSTIGFGSGTIATGLALTAAAGAVTSQGAVASTPSGAMNAVIGQTGDFASFMTAFKPSTSDMVAFAAWTNATVDNYVYVMWDTDITLTTSSFGSSALGQIANAAYDGTFGIYETSDINLAAFVMGMIASIDFAETNGRTNAAFRTQSGLTPQIVNQTIAAQLEANGCNFFGAWGTANDRFLFLYPGAITGKFRWLDTYVNQIWMNNQFQLALLLFLTQVKSVPYNQVGYAMIEAACMDVINQAVNFGAVVPGVTLSSAQVAEVNNAAGLKIDTVLASRGWYLQVRDATPQVRAARGTPPCTFWYMDGGSVQRLGLASVTVQ